MFVIYLDDGSDDPMYFKGTEDHWSSKAGYETSVDFALNIGDATQYGSKEEAEEIIDSLEFTGFNWGTKQLP